MPTAPHPSRFRLPADVRPTGYDLHLEPDLEGGAFRGEVRIALRLTRPRAEIVLHAAELAIERALAHSGGREIPGRVRLARADETAALRFPRPLSAGEATLALRFSGRLNQHLRGFYAASADGGRYAFSQCEAADARRILPCFDEPAFKARFRVAVTVRDGETAVSNGPVEREEPVPLAERKRAAEVIAHGLAHMWYGDLVTMAWWDDLWLNEAFATWMAYRVVADWRPEWRMWQGFEHDRAAALGMDALANTHPIYARVRSVAEATENFDAITYEKGAAVVRMIEHYLGPDAFRAGVRLYMRRHREGNTVAADLWRALEEASGKPVARVAQTWIAQPGFPLVSIAPARDGGPAALGVRQERFFADPRVPAARRRGKWPVPLVGKWRGGGDAATA